MILELQIEKGLTMLFITHDLGLTRKIGDRIGVMLKGKLVESGPAAKVMGCPGHPYTRLLIDGALGKINTMTFEPESVQSQGCPFTSRCDRSQKRCLSNFPVSVCRDKGGHNVWCHFPLA
jgi:peptide/nickel transport system ATP-binding protein